MTLFKRRDTRFWVVALGGFLALLPLTLGLGTPWYWPAIQVPLAVLVFVVVAALIMRWRRHLPPDIDLRWIDPAEAERLLAAPPLPDRTLLSVSFERDRLRRYRLDVLVDDHLVGQLPPGTGLLLPLRPGEHRLSVYLDRPRSAVAETINSIPGGYAGFTIRNRGGKTIGLQIARDPADGPHLGQHMRLVHPAVPEI